MRKRLMHNLLPLRKKNPPAERIFWKAVRNRKLQGFKFIRRHPIPCETRDGDRVFIADFYCPDRKLAVEIEELDHERQPDYEELRSLAIQLHDLQVVRFTNYEIEHDMGRVITTLLISLYPSP